MKKKTLLIELSTEELPAKKLFNLSKLFFKLVVKEFCFYKIDYKNIEWFSTPRRLAVKVNDIDFFISFLKRKKEKDNELYFSKNKKKINFVNVNFDNQKKCKNKLKNNNLDTKYDENKCINTLISKIVISTIRKLTLKSTLMRWNEKSIKFIRPVRNILVLLDNKVILVNMFGMQSNRLTFGHFYMEKKVISVIDASEYPNILEKKGRVIADYYVRKNIILNKLKEKANSIGGIIKISEKLLEEVTFLVEWPNVLIASFPNKFLSLPSDIVINIMEKYQKFFPIFNKNNELTNRFFLISNIVPKCSKSIISGNEKVIVARLEDAQFFFSIDRKKKLKDYSFNLKNIVFHTSLGSLFNRTTRIVNLVKYLCNLTKSNKTFSIKAAKLSKCDLVTNVVKEFPDMQGNIGSIYALLDGENKEVALAIKEQYKHINEEEDVPYSMVSCNLMLADKIDMLVGMFIANNKLSGSGDPFGMRRAAIGLVLIILKQKIQISLDSLIKKSISEYESTIMINSQIKSDIMRFVLERIFHLYLHKNYNKSVINSVISLNNKNLIVIDNKIKFINDIYSSKDFIKLINLYKRLNKILKKNNLLFLKKIDVILFRNRQEKVLYRLFLFLKKRIFYFKNKNKCSSFFKFLNKLISLVDYFFKTVLINHKDKDIKLNRLSILNSILSMLNTIVDFSVF